MVACTMAWCLLVVVLLLASTPATLASSNTNHVYQPCIDTKIQRSDGFTLGIAFSRHSSFFLNNTQLSPCDKRLDLSSNSRIALFRPKVDQISILTVNSTLNTYVSSGGYMVAFAGRKHAARSSPSFIGNETYTVTSFTLVLEFSRGTLQNLYWKRDGCSSCSGKSSFVCINGQMCAVKTSRCKGRGGEDDCSLGIQLAFSGTDKHLAVLNSWYEVSKLQQYSLYGLYSNLKNSFTSLYKNSN